VFWWSVYWGTWMSWRWCSSLKLAKSFPLGLVRSLSFGRSHPVRQGWQIRHAPVGLIECWGTNTLTDTDTGYNILSGGPRLTLTGSVLGTDQIVRLALMTMLDRS